jgi:hypothetical protein
MLSPHGAAAQQTAQPAIGLLEATGQPRDMFVDLGTNARRDPGSTVALRSQNLDELAPASDQRPQRLSLGIGQRPHHGTNCIREVRQDARVDRIVLASLPVALPKSRT